MKPVICLVLIVCGVAFASAQEKVIDQAAFDAVVTAGRMHTQKWAGKMYRMTLTTSGKMSERPELDHSLKIIYEYGLNDDHRISSSSTRGGKATTADSVSIGNWIYSRTGTEPWTRKERQSGSDSGKSSESGNAVEILSSVTEYKNLGVGDIKGEAVQIYLRTERTKEVYKSTGRTNDSERARKYWINAEGLILKEVLVSDNRWIDSSSHSTLVSEWELDPTLVFKAPQIAP